MDEQPAQPSNDIPPPSPLAYEETPVIESPANPVPVATTPPPRKGFGKRLMGTLGTFLLFVILFTVGVWLSGIVRNVINRPSEIASAPTPQPTPQASVSQEATPSTTMAPKSAWITYGVISGVTRAAVPGISFQLPPSVAAPSCDGTNCASQGTYLPGGTRFTVSARGEGQVLKDFRGSIISDLQGQALTVGQVTVAGRRAVEFQGVFKGATANGGLFDQMHGMMVEVTNTISLEINHFTPAGVTANFVQDDVLFSDIIASIRLTP